jgi:YidC/Oxa1 family membrane protein insertase
MEQGRVWLAIFLSLGLFFVYDYFVIRPYREVAKNQVGTSSTLPPPATSDAPPPLEAPNPMASADVVRSGAPIIVETDLFRATIDSLGGRLRSFELKRYRAHVGADSPDLSLFAAEGLPVLPLTLEIAGQGTDAGTQYVTDKTSLVLNGDSTGTITLNGVLPGGSRIEKTFTFKGSSYDFSLDADVSGSPIPMVIGVVMTPIVEDVRHLVKGDRTAGRAEKALAFADGKLTEHPLTEIQRETTQLTGALWAGYASQYFVSLVVSDQPSKRVVMGPMGGVGIVRVDEETENGIARYRVLIGPKDPQVLSAAGDHLDRALDFGWFWFIAIPLLHLLRIFDRVFGNYGVSIIVLTVLVKAVTIPLTRAQYRSMQKMQQIQPHLERLRERYKDDSTGMQREMMELYRKHGVNPFSGCVPMFLQIPIFVGLYNALLNAIELRHAPFVGWINDLSAPDRLMVGGVGIPVLVILMGASMLAQQWMTPAQGDPMQRRMMMFMPVIFTAMFLNFPSGLVLYWLVNNVISIGQQYAVMRGVKQGARG